MRIESMVVDYKDKQEFEEHEIVMRNDGYVWNEYTLMNDRCGDWVFRVRYNNIYLINK